MFLVKQKKNLELSDSSQEKKLKFLLFVVFCSILREKMFKAM